MRGGGKKHPVNAPEAASVHHIVASPQAPTLHPGVANHQLPPDNVVAGQAAAAAWSTAVAAAAAPTGPAPRATTGQSPPLPAFTPPSWDLLYNIDELERRLQPLLGEPAIGVDIEWRPTFVAGKPPNPVALLQLSSMSRCVLIPVRHLRHFPPSLATILSSPRIWKIGCGVEADAKKLLSDCALECTPTFEVGNVAQRLQRQGQLRFPGLADGEEVRPGLRGLALACGYDLEKPKRLSRSNWEMRPLSAQQQRYAALDAYAGIWIARCVHALNDPPGGDGRSSKKAGNGRGAGGFARWLLEQASQQSAAVQQAKPRTKPSRNKRKLAAALAG